MRRIIKRHIPLIMAFVFWGLCACSGDADRNQVVLSETPVEEETDAFVPDYSPGEENRVGNIWTNTTLCAQGSYVYHYNQSTGYFEKWLKTDAPENASAFFKQPEVEGHIEVVGDYIYFCQKSGEKLGNDEFYNVVRVRTDGSNQAIVVSDCLNGQYRIVDNTLFYLTLTHEQSDASTESYYIEAKQMFLWNFSELSFSIPATGTMKVPASSYDSTHDPTDFFVILSDSCSILGYTYKTNSKTYVVSYNMGQNSELGNTWMSTESGDVKSYNCGDSLIDTDFWRILYPMEDGTKIYFMGRDSGYDSFFSRTYSVSAAEWPDISNAELVPIKGGTSSNGYSWSSLRCVADEKLFYDCVDGLCVYDTITDDITKVNNDKPTQIEYAGDGRLYYSWYQDQRTHYYCCNLDGSDWRELSW